MADSPHHLPIVFNKQIERYDAESLASFLGLGKAPRLGISGVELIFNMEPFAAIPVYSSEPISRIRISKPEPAEAGALA